MNFRIVNSSNAALVPLKALEPHRNTLYRWIKHGVRGVRLPSVKIGNRIFVDPEKVAELIDTEPPRKTCELLPLPEIDGERIRYCPKFVGYAVTDKGRVLSCRSGKWRELRQHQRRARKNGRVSGMGVGLIGSEGHEFAAYVHRLVLEAFVGPCPEGMEACHFPDRNPKNNSLDNLRWDTRKANSHDSFLHGTRIRGEKAPSAILKENEVRIIKRLIRRWMDDKPLRMDRFLGDWFGVSLDTISEIRRGRNWRWVES